jgi:hypothetical protein
LLLAAKRKLRLLQRASADETLACAERHSFCWF